MEGLVKMDDNIIIILAAGRGIRYKSDIPKQFTSICGKELLAYSVDEMRKSKYANHIIAVVNDDTKEIMHVKETYDIETIAGGHERRLSFQRAIDYIKKYYPKCKKVIYHEAARPLIKCEVIDKYFELLDTYDYVESCKNIVDSLGSYVVQTPRREDYYLIQAPEAYRFSVLSQYYDCNSNIYFAANQFPSFVKGYQYFGIKHNIKLTSPDDKAVIEYLLRSRSKE